METNQQLIKQLRELVYAATEMLDVLEPNTQDELKSTFYLEEEVTKAADLLIKLDKALNSI